MGQRSRTVAPVADHGGHDPAPDAGRRPEVAAALVLVLAALAGELRAPAPVLPAPIALGSVALAAAGLAALVVTTGPALVTGREVRTGALVPVGLVTFLVVGPRFRLMVLMLWLLAGLLALGVAIAAVTTIPTRRRDGVTALVAVVTITIGGWFGEGVVREARLAVHADRYRSEAEALTGGGPSADDVYPDALDEPFLAAREPGAIPGNEGHRHPITVAWLWDPGEDGPAASWGVLYAPDGGPRVHGLTGGHALRCTAAVVDDFYWCSFN
jgi:hypothetical protein